MKSYFGTQRQRGRQGKLKRGRGTLKQPVFGVFEREGRVYTEMVKDCKRLPLQAVILGKVSIESVIYMAGGVITAWWMSVIRAISSESWHTRICPRRPLSH